MLRLFDYLLAAFPGFLNTIWAQWRIVRAYAAGSKVPAASGRTGAEAARAVLIANGLSAFAIVPAAGELSNHYDPLRKVLRLSHRIHDGRSLAALVWQPTRLGTPFRTPRPIPGSSSGTGSFRWPASGRSSSGC